MAGENQNVTVGVKIAGSGGPQTRDQVDEVVNALQDLLVKLKSVSTETGHVSTVFQESGEKMSFMARSLEGFKTTLEFLGINATVVGLAELGRQGLETAATIGTLSERTGASTESLSVLKVAAGQAEVDFVTLGQAFKFLAENVEKVNNGDAKAIKAFRDIGLTVKDIKGQKPEEVFKKVADAISNFPDSFKITKIGDIFGEKSNINLVPVLDKIANEGFGNLEKKAQSMGLVVDRETAESAHKFVGMMNLVKTASAAFIADTAIQLVEAVKSIGDAFEDTHGQAVDFSNFLGGDFTNLLRGAFVDPFKNFGKNTAREIETVKASIKEVAIGIGATSRVLKAFLEDGFSGAKDEFDAIKDQIQGVEDAWQHAHDRIFGNKLQFNAELPTDHQNKLIGDIKRVQAALQAHFNGQPIELKVDLAHATEDQLEAELNRLKNLMQQAFKTLTPEEQQAVDQARAAALELAKAQADAAAQGIEDTKKIQQANLAQQEADAKALFAQGLSNLTKYYAARKRVVQDSTTSEIEALKARADAIRAAIRVADANLSSEKKRETFGIEDEANQQTKIRQIEAQRVQLQAQLASTIAGIPVALAQGAATEKALLAEEVQQRKLLGETILGYEIRRKEAIGQTVAAALDGIKKETEAFKLALLQRGDTASSAEQQAQEFARAQKEKLLADTILGYESEIQSAREDTMRLTLRNIDIETQNFKAAMLARGEALQDVEKKAAEFKGIKVDNAILDDAEARAQKIFNLIQQNRQALQQDVEQHVRNQTEATDLDVQFQQSQKQRLREILETLDKINLATAPDDVVARVQALRSEVQGLGVDVRKLQPTAEEFFSSFEEGFGGAIQDFLTQDTSQIEDFGDVVKSFTVDVLQSLRQVSSEIVATMAKQALFEGFKEKLFGAKKLTGDALNASTTQSVGQDIADVVGKTASETAATAQQTAAATILQGAAATELSASTLLQTGAATLQAGASTALAAGGLMQGAGIGLTTAAGFWQPVTIELNAAAETLLAAATILAASGGVALAEGGLVRGPGTGTSDSIPAWLSNNEFVIPAKAVNYYGAERFEAYRKLQVPKEITVPIKAVTREVAPLFRGIRGYRDGGLVSVSTPPVSNRPLGGGTADPGKLDISATLGLDRGVIVEAVKAWLQTPDGRKTHVKVHHATRKARKNLPE